MEDTRSYPKRGQFNGLIGERPSGLTNRPKTSLEVIRFDLQDLVANLGLAKVFSNHTDIQNIIERLQSRLFQVLNSETPFAKSISEADVAGLAKCTNYFSQTLPLVVIPPLPSQNKAGAFIYAAQTSCRKLLAGLGQLSDLDILTPAPRQFFHQLVSLLGILERVEYHHSHIKEKFN